MKQKKQDFSHEIRGLIFNGIFAVLSLAIVVNFYRNIHLTTLLLSVLAIIAILKWRNKMILKINGKEQKFDNEKLNITESNIINELVFKGIIKIDSTQKSKSTAIP